MVEVIGALLNDFYAAGQKVRLPLAEPDHKWDPQHWYPAAELQSVLHESGRYSDPAPILERLGEEMMRKFCGSGPGRAMAPDSMAFLRRQGGSTGYRMVVRGSPGEAGEFELLEFDEARGYALIRSTTIFPRHMELGLLSGGLQAAGDLLFHDVRLRPDATHFDVYFVHPGNLTSIDWAPHCDRAEWEARSRLRAFERRELFLTSINETLHLAMGALVETQARLRLQDKLAALGRLTAGVLHEINNPANFAQAGAQALLVQLEQFRKFLLDLAGADAAPDVRQALNVHVDELRQLAGVVLEGTSRIGRLAHDLRDLREPDPKDKQAVPLACSLANTVSLVKTQYGRTATFESRFRANPTVLCWPDQLDQVFTNLLVNACHAIERKREAGGKPGRLVVTLDTTEDQAVVTIDDDGCGIPEASLERIFEPFFTTKEPGKGTGLGLSISFAIIAAHGGDIQVESRELVGTRFVIRLPLSGAPTSAPA